MGLRTTSTFGTRTPSIPASRLAVSARLVRGISAGGLITAGTLMAVVRPEHVVAFMAICRKWDVEATVIGEVTSDGTLTMTWRGNVVVQIPPRTAADGPVYQRPLARPDNLESLRANGAPT